MKYRAEADFVPACLVASFRPSVMVELDMPSDLPAAEQFAWADAALKGELVRRGIAPRLDGPVKLSGPFPEE